jgi:hypothetical protein
MAGKLFKHIFLPGPTRTQEFTNPRRGGGSGFLKRERNRGAHSARLKERFETAWNAAEKTRSAVAVRDRKGVYLEFKSDPGFDLKLQSLENIRSGIRLLTTKTLGEGEKKQTLAAVYIPRNRRSYFLNKIRAYTEEIDRRSNKPKNSDLVGSISDIRLATLETFWQDRSIPLPGDELTSIEVWLSSDQQEVIERFQKLLQ